MDHIYWLSQLKSSEKSLVGEKVLILSHLLQYGYPVLPGYVVASSALTEFLQSLDGSSSLIGNLLDSDLHVDVANYKALQSFSQKSRQIILETPFPQELQAAIFNSAQKLNSATLILRPSLVIPINLRQRHQGLWNSQVCLCKPEAISLGIKKVWGELFSAKSIFYWQKLGINLAKLSVAVLIQPLKEALASGTIEISSTSIEMSVSWGLGHSLLKGEVQPDIYSIERKTATIKAQQLGNKVIAYHVLSEHKFLSEEQHLLQAEMVSEEKQKEYALEDTAVKQLVQLVEEVVKEDSQIKYIEWLLPSENDSAKIDRALTLPQFFLTQLNYHPSFVSSSIKNLSKPNTTQPYLQGLAVASGTVTAPVFVLNNSTEKLLEIPNGIILVTSTILLNHISVFNRVVGIITEKGGITSHGAIVARELNIPAIVGVTDAMSKLKSGEQILLDGNSGEIYQIREADMNQEHEMPQKTLVASAPGSFPNYPIATQLMVNLSQPSSIAPAANLPVDGVGVIRSELMLADILFSHSPETWLDNDEKSYLQEHLTNLLRQVATAFTPRPVFYRSLDWQSSNSLTDSRGTYGYQQDSTLFTLELAALTKVMQEGYNNFNLILPFVRSIEEFRFCHRLIEKAGLTDYPYFQVWIMAEVPSVIFLLSEYVRAGVQGIAIGTNDLTQLILGIDREQDHFVRRGLNANHPAMLKAIAQLINNAQLEGIPCSICGQAPVDNPTLIERLIQWGITSISVEPQAVTSTYRSIARAEQRLLLSKVRK